MLLVLLCVGELDHEGGAAALHGQAVVHRLDGKDRNLSVGEGNEGATCNFISLKSPNKITATVCF